MSLPMMVVKAAAVSVDCNKNGCLFNIIPFELRAKIFTHVLLTYYTDINLEYLSSLSEEVKRLGNYRGRGTNLELALIGERTLYRELFSQRIRNSHIYTGPRRIYADPSDLTDIQIHFSTPATYSPLFRKGVRSVIISIDEIQTPLSAAKTAKLELQLQQCFIKFMSKDLSSCSNLTSLSITLPRFLDFDWSEEFKTNKQLPGFEDLLSRRTLRVLEVHFRSGNHSTKCTLRKALNAGLGSGGRKVTVSILEDCYSWDAGPGEILIWRGTKGVEPN